MQSMNLLSSPAITRGGDASPILSMSNMGNKRRHVQILSSESLLLGSKHASTDARNAAPAVVTSSETQKTSKDLWFLHGKFYDLSEFVESHPGGSTILKMTQGLPDGTPLMESYHAFANKEYIAKTLSKYEVSYMPSDADSRLKTETQYTFEPTGFYATLTQRVRKHFGSVKENESITKRVKADRVWVIKGLLQTLVFIVCYSVAFLVPNQNRAISSIAAALAGTVMVAVGMTCMHDASHYAVGAKDSWKNKLVLRVWTAIAFWDPSMWLYHHTVRHHGFTGDCELDPDTQHAKPFVRKHLSTARSKYLSFPKVLALERGFWAFYALLIYTLSPGMFLGQILSYRILWPLKGRLWKMGPVPKGAFEKHAWEDLLTLLMIIPHFYKASPLVSFVFVTACNIAYAICIVPDHDTFESAVENHVQGGRIDWGEVQVRHSADFGGKDFLGNMFTQNFGGINVQIAHHLYPSLNHVYLPEIAPIIKETCKEFNIPYTDHGSVSSALWSFAKTVHACMGLEDVTAGDGKKA